MVWRATLQPGPTKEASVQTECAPTMNVSVQANVDSSKDSSDSNDMEEGEKEKKK